MTTDDIRTAIRDALHPVNESVRELSGRFEKFQISTAVQLTEISKDLKHVCDGHAALVADVKEVREGWPLIEAHMQREEDTQSFNLAQATNKKSDPEMARISLPKGSLKWIGWIIAAALLGAALAGAAILGKSSGVQEGAQEATQYFTAHPPYAAGQDEGGDK